MNRAGKNAWSNGCRRSRPGRRWRQRSGCGVSLADDETARGLTRSPEPEPGFIWPAYRWAKNESLDRVLSATADSGPPMSAGDFVRWSKQLLDLLGQIAAVPSTGSPIVIHGSQGGTDGNCGHTSRRGRPEHVDLIKLAPGVRAAQ